MSNLARDIGSEDLKIQELVKFLREDKYLIPTFQRDFVWEPANILKLWDSMYRFYPIGSILYWETDKYLHTHRRLGGFISPHDEDSVRKFREWKYILDGQQRATSLLVSLVGGRGRVADDPNFDYTLYFDATATDGSESGRKPFFFAGDLEERKKTTPEPFLIRVRDVADWSFTFYKEVSAVPGFNPVIEQHLQQLGRMFSDYKIQSRASRALRSTRFATFLSGSIRKESGLIQSTSWWRGRTATRIWRTVGQGFTFATT
jgi:hypothetical protein